MSNKKYVLSGLVAVSLIAFAGCGNKKAPVSEGALYQTDTISFWVGVGHAYMSFEYTSETGYVFNVNVNAGDGYSSWLSGAWDLGSSLSLTASWEEGDNSTSLVDAESGKTKTYTAVNGVYTIEVNLPSAGAQKFLFDPSKDKVGEKEEATTSEEAVTEAEKKAQLTLASGRNESAQEAKMILYTDNSWELSVSFYDGGDYSVMALGTWANGNDEEGNYFVKLTVTEDSGNVLAEEEYRIVIDYSDMSDMKYTLTMTLEIPVVGETTFTLNKA